LIHSASKALKRTFLAALLAIAGRGAAIDTSVAPKPASAPVILARSAILIDATTGDVLYEKAADTPIPPASLAKLMTIHLAYEAVEEGRFSLETLIPIHKEDCYPDLPYRSSLMFLGGGMRVTLGELLTGLAIPSGNDAAFAVARAVSGSIEDFARAMTEAARDMGLSATTFVEPSGLSERNMTTAREFAEFCRRYIRLHPSALKDLHSLKSISFPLLKNMPEGYAGPERAVYQENRNTLVRDYPGCDGLKTGYIDESGFNIALTAERSGTRLIGVILSGYGVSTAEGSKTRADNGSKLLDYGFDSFLTLRPRIGPLSPVRVWKGKARLSALIPEAEVAVTVRKEDAENVRVLIDADEDAIAPVKKGQRLGEAILSLNGRILKRAPLVASADVPRGNFIVRAWDSIVLLFKGRR
jgi:serine-type D-Ala-D-Ala carboxypeptidase (penicillin-binding protein 5/6)